MSLTFSIYRNILKVDNLENFVRFRVYVVLYSMYLVPQNLHGGVILCNLLRNDNEKRPNTLLVLVMKGDERRHASHRKKLTTIEDDENRYPPS